MPTNRPSEIEGCVASTSAMAACLQRSATSTERQSAAIAGTSDGSSTAGRLLAGSASSETSSSVRSDAESGYGTRNLNMKRSSCASGNG